MSPVRVQRKRTKGWRMPENTIYVGRGSKWGNPFKVGEMGFSLPDGTATFYCRGGASAENVVSLFKRYTVPMWRGFGFDVAKLRGKNLACWCPLDQPCHADVLLELANRPTHEIPGLTAHQEGTQ